MKKFFEIHFVVEKGKLFAVQSNVKKKENLEFITVPKVPIASELTAMLNAYYKDPGESTQLEVKLELELERVKRTINKSCSCEDRFVLSFILDDFFVDDKLEYNLLCSLSATNLFSIEETLPLQVGAELEKTACCHRLKVKIVDIKNRR